MSCSRTRVFSGIEIPKTLSRDGRWPEIGEDSSGLAHEYYKEGEGRGAGELYVYWKLFKIRVFAVTLCRYDVYKLGNRTKPEVESKLCS